MKKSIFIAVLGMASVVASYGQGYINFANYNSSTQLNGVTYASGPSAGMAVGPEISVTLLYGASTDTSLSQLQALNYTSGGNSSPAPFGLGVATTPGAIGTGAGWFIGGAVLVPGTPGSTYAFALEASGMLNGVAYTGFSSIFTGATQASSTVGIPNLPDGLFLGSFTVSPVPEPTTLALAGLGGLASLVAFRRKQA